MLPIFTNSYKAQGAITTHPTSARFRELVKINVGRLQEYYYSNVRAVPNSHPLVQALKHLPPYTDDPVDLFNMADARYPYISKNFNFTTDYNRGTFLGHKVYSSANNMIYSTSEYVSPYRAVNNWQNLYPIKCLWVDSTFMDMSVPSATLNVDSEFTSISVDLPLLSLMYKGFKESMRDSELVLGQDQFIATRVLPTMIESQVDMTCISATIALFEGKHTLQSRVNAPIFLNSYSAEFTKIAEYALNRIEGSKMQYVHMLQSMPTVYADNAAQALILPDFSPTTQVDWAMMATRLKVINFLLDVGGKAGRQGNSGFIQKLKPYCRDIQMSRIPYTRMTDNMASFIDDTLTKIQRLK